MAAPVQDVIMLFGDSITQGCWEEGGFGQRLSHVYARKLDVLNRGLSGYNTDWAIPVLKQCLSTDPNHRPRIRIFTCWFGANDACIKPSPQHVPLEKFTSNLREIVSLIKSPSSPYHSPLTKILLITPPPVNTLQRGADLQSRTPPMALDRLFDITKAYAEAVKQVADAEKVAVVDIWTILWEAAGKKEEDLSQYLNDGLHLNKEGYQIMYDVLLETIQTNYPDLDPEALPQVFPPTEFGEKRNLDWPIHVFCAASSVNTFFYHHKVIPKIIFISFGPSGARISTSIQAALSIQPSNDFIRPTFATVSTSASNFLTTSFPIFGNDVSNKVGSPTPSSQSGASQSGSKRIQRSALPMEWLMGGDTPEEAPQPRFSAPPPLTLDDDAMDVDTSYDLETATGYQFPATAVPTASSNLNNLFFESTSPMSRRSFESPSGHQHKKRRSHSPESAHRYTSSPQTLASSPSQQKLERISSGSLFSSKPSLEGLGAAPQSANGLKRPRRPALSAMVQTADVRSAQSAFPILTSVLEGDREFSPPARRAFSALIPHSAMPDQLSDESSFEGVEVSSPAQAYARRQQLKTIRRCDGTEDFRPLTGVTAMVTNESPPGKQLSPGLPGFGDNEAHGKILPCHRVTEDGLMRITPSTLNRLLDGAYEDNIRDFHIIDCRFDYEYDGGHIPGAVNINTATQVEQLLLGPSLTKPKPSISGDSAKKTVLVFHCEFSAKRAPTFAKHLRAKDRAMNNHIYPKIHYPEVYILQGGYCGYFKECSVRCEPPAYVTMDDPSHLASRREDLDQFRKTKFGRHKSYTYGDGAKTSMMSQQQLKRNTVPSSGPPALFAAASAARSRRGAGSLTTLTEDGNTTADADDTDIDLGDSPCPPPAKSGVVRGKKILGRTLVRAETYGPTRMPLH
ncbi:hypothetical protein C8J56DRAFT_894617 [Mycena floridula]|nr:hypothetical protein C8J56DRAFT_894617 [Mycena floridula]